MTQFDGDQIPADLNWVAERLEHERPTASALELDRMKVRATSQAVRGARSQRKGSFLKSRVAITAILMLGLLTGGTGTTLALSGGDADSAANVQYPREANPTPPGRVLGTTQGGGPGNDQVLGSTESAPGGGAQGGQGVQGSQQVAAADTGGDLPFTGLAAVPLIVLGLGLVAAGGMLYRSARRAPSEA